MKGKEEKTPKHAQEPRSQYAALPFRLTPAPEILLVSSRETKRWVIPKGWPMKGRKPHAAAAQEALEEAGLEGRIAKEPVGAYQYLKKLRNGASIPCQVRVYPLEVTRQRKKWREREQRITRWFPLDEAADVVRETELARIIREFSHALRQSKNPAKNPAENHDEADQKRGVSNAAA